MRFLDLEHEMDHIDQWSRFLAQGIHFFTDIYSETKRGTKAINSEHPQSLRMWQNAIIEYHARLQELIRLDSRNVERSVLHDHAQEALIWSMKYWGKGMGLGNSTAKKDWQQQFFPDIEMLRERANELFSKHQFYFSLSLLRSRRSF